jgi:low affinity Fe/Cu permease
MAKNSMEKFACAVSDQAGRPWATIAATLSVVVWAATYWMFSSVDTWMLIINTGTTIITFIMVFLIQASQNRHETAIQAKLDELIKSIRDADNSLIGIEQKSREEIDEKRGLP